MVMVRFSGMSSAGSGTVSNSLTGVDNSLIGDLVTVATLVALHLLRGFVARAAAENSSTANRS
jgi:hypothetical protein